MKLNSNSSAGRVKIGFGKAWLCRQIIDSLQIAASDCDFGCDFDFESAISIEPAARDVAM